MLTLSILFNVLIVSYILGKRIYYNKPGVEPIGRSEVLASIQNMVPITENDVVFIGDSITAAFPVQELYKARNLGIPGDTSYDVLNRIVAYRSPKVVYIQVGINDLVAGTTLYNYLQNLKMIVEHFPNSKVYVHSLFPNEKYTFKILPWNEGIKELCVQYKAEFIDVYNPFLPFELYTWDGSHLNRKGYEKWAEVINERRF